MKVLRVNKVTPVTQTDYLLMLDEAMVQTQPKDTLTTSAQERKELQIALMDTLVRKQEMK
jgi:hypothetical protein